MTSRETLEKSIHDAIAVEGNMGTQEELDVALQAIYREHDSLLASRRTMLVALADIERLCCEMLYHGHDNVDIGHIARMARAGIDSAGVV